MGVLNLFKEENKKVFYHARTYKNTNLDQFKRDLRFEKWNNVLSDTISLDKNYSNLITIILGNFNKNFPPQ